MARTNRYKTEQVIEALQKARGIKAVAAKILECSRRTVDNYIERYVTVKAAYEEQRETLVDIAEGKLMKKLDADEWPAIKFVLTTLGKGRGYTERTEVTGAEGGRIDLNVVLDEVGRVLEMGEDEFTDLAGTLPDLETHGTLEKMAEVEG